MSPEKVAPSNAITGSDSNLQIGKLQRAVSVCQRGFESLRAGPCRAKLADVKMRLLAFGTESLRPPKDLAAGHNSRTKGAWEKVSWFNVA
jgi:hypothetical protein